MGVEVENAERILAKARADVLAILPGESVITSMLIGTPGAAIADAAREWHSQYIVLGAGRHGHLERLLVGDTVVRVVHHSVVPVIAVPASCGALPRNGIVALDFGRASLAAARSAARVIGAGVLHLVHVRPELDVPATDPSAWSDVYETGTEDLMTRLARELTEHHNDVRIEKVLLRGHPTETLLNFAIRAAADLIAVGQHSHGTVERFLFGSVAHGLVRGAHCPVLVAPPAMASPPL
jgi:nucleotide-binding universal stress UspA family protein